MLRCWLKVAFLCLCVSSTVNGGGISEDESEGPPVRVLQLVKKETYVSRDFERELRTTFESLLAQKMEEPWGNGFTPFAQPNLFVEANGVPYRLHSMMASQVTDLNGNPRFLPDRTPPPKGVNVPSMLCPMHMSEFWNFWNSDKLIFLPYGPDEVADRDLVCTSVFTVKPVSVSRLGEIGVSEKSVSGHSPMYYLFFHFREPPTDGNYASYKKLPVRFPSTIEANEMVCLQTMKSSERTRKGRNGEMELRVRNSSSVSEEVSASKPRGRNSGLGGQRKSPRCTGFPIYFATHALIFGLEALGESEAHLLASRFRELPPSLSCTTLDGLQALKLIPNRMRPYDRTLIFEELATLPKENLEIIVIQTIRLITSDMDVYDRIRIIVELAAIPKENLENIVTQTLKLISNNVGAYDRVRIIGELVTIPKENLEFIVRETLKLITINMNALEIVRIIEAMKKIQKGMIKGVLKKALGHHTKDMKGYDIACAIEEALQ